VKKGGNTQRILIMNLTRMGDLLQMTPFLNGFRQENPDMHITLMVLKEFGDVCKGFPFVDEIEVFDAIDFMMGLDTDRSMVESFRILEKIANRLKQKHFDRVVNLSFSNVSALLTHLLGVGDVRGITIDDQGNRLLKHPWIIHFYNIVSHREVNLFNFVDFIRKIGGCNRKASMAFAVSKSGRRFAETFCTDHGVIETDFVVGFQLGASRKNRWWPTESFARLSEQLIREGGKIILFGSAGEVELGEKVRESVSLPSERIASHLFDMTGKTSVDQLAALVEKCDLLVTCDTGTMHVATAVGTQVVALFFGPAYFPETGPYGEDHLVIQADVPCAPCGHETDCKNPLCRESISVSHVHRVIHMLKAGMPESGRQLKDRSEWKGVQLYRGGFDEDGMLEFLPLIRRPLKRMDFLRQIYREMWKIVLNEQEGEIDPARVNEKMHRFFSVEESPQFLSEDRRAFEALISVAQQGIDASSRLIRWSEKIENNISAIRAEARVIHDIDGQIELHGLTHPACSTLAFMFRQGKENLEEGNVRFLSQRTLDLYKTLHREATLMTGALERIASSMKAAA